MRWSFGSLTRPQAPWRPSQVPVAHPYPMNTLQGLPGAHRGQLVGDAAKRWWSGVAFGTVKRLKRPVTVALHPKPSQALPCNVVTYISIKIDSSSRGTVTVCLYISLYVSRGKNRYTVTNPQNSSSAMGFGVTASVSTVTQKRHSISSVSSGTNVARETPLAAKRTVAVEAVAPSSLRRACR